MLEVATASHHNTDEVCDLLSHHIQSSDTLHRHHVSGHLSLSHLFLLSCPYLWQAPSGGGQRDSHTHQDTPSIVQEDTTPFEVIPLPEPRRWRIPQVSPSHHSKPRGWGGGGHWCIVSTLFTASVQFIIYVM